MDKPRADKAAIVPLNFGGRTEHNVILFASNLNQLVTLLNDPVKYVRDIQGDFPFHSSVDRLHRLPWSLRPPVTAFLRPGYPPKVKTTEGSGGLTFGDSGILQRTAKAFSFANMNTELTMEELLDIFMADHPNGAFYAEFALNTRTIFITYFQPIPSKPTTDPPRYRQRRTPITINRISDSILPVGPQSLVHFDLDRSPDFVLPLDRAEFVVSYIENLGFLGDMMVSQDDFGSATTQMAPRTTGITVTPVTGSARPTFKSKVTDETIPYPTIVVESLSDGDGPIAPCTVVPVVYEGGTYIYYDMLIKSYS